MSTTIRCDAGNPDPAVIAEIADELEAGKIVVIPTETQYGLCLRADRDDSMEIISSVKRRNQAVKSALFVKDMVMAGRFCMVNDIAHTLAELFLPGPLTMVLPPKANQCVVCNDFASNHGFGVRISSSPIVYTLMNRLPFPVTATSANLSGNLTPPEVNRIKETFGDDVSLYIDCGPLRTKIPSTVVRVHDDDIEVVRHGLIAERDLRRHLNKGGMHGGF